MALAAERAKLTARHQTVQLVVVVVLPVDGVQAGAACPVAGARRRVGGAEAPDAMLAALAGDGSARSAWTEGGAGFGCREAAALERRGAASPMCADHAGPLNDRQIENPRLFKELNKISLATQGACQINFR